MIESAGPIELALPEFEPRRYSPSELPHEVAHRIWQEYPTQIAVDFPSPKTDGQYELTNRGWVGIVPLGRDAVVSLEPKVPLANVFRMLEYAYRLDAFGTSNDTAGVDSMREVYESLARVLARRVRDRTRKGLHRTYQGREDRLSVVRGRLQLRRLAERPASARLHCHFEEHTADHIDNRLLFAALDRILRSGICGREAQAEVRQVHRILRGAVTPKPLAARHARGRSYDRLNHDYRPMHALAAFFLDHTGPTHRRGEARMVPFLLNMAVLFEKFVAAWLKENLAADLRIADQVTDYFDVERQIGLRIDLVLSDRFGRHLAVLDTKYKKHQSPTQDDINQAVAYASKKRCGEAILIYPHATTMKHTINVGDVRVRTVGFPLHASLQEGGAQIMSLVHQVTTQA